MKAITKMGKNLALEDVFGVKLYMMGIIISAILNKEKGMDMAN